MLTSDDRRNFETWTQKRFPIRWNHLTDKIILQNKEIERVFRSKLIGHRSSFEAKPIISSGHSIVGLALCHIRDNMTFHLGPTIRPRCSRTMPFSALLFRPFDVKTALQAASVEVILEKRQQCRPLDLGAGKSLADPFG